ncbi:sugar ABC transporter substrate-binding protein [Bacillota bacterium Meth-B3]|nr:sugar ABC transporter substrate-binding protein [Christensenellaceae bacterium]MEA5067371.1 sugar ABC transporter substrate-binding protein [Christensenellaceae bacterium]
MKKLTCILLAMVLVLGLGAGATAEGAKRKFGLMLYSEVDEATISIRTGVEKACAENGVELETYSIEMDYTKCPTYLQMFFDHGCDAIIDVTWSAEVGLVTSQTCAAKGVPLITCDVGYDDYAHLVGANNYNSGRVNGEYVADWVKENWGGKIDYVLAMYLVSTGEGVKQRITGCLDVLGENGLMPADDHVVWFDGASTELCYGYVMNWLQANPQAKNVYIINNNDSGALGSYNACVAMGREADCIITSYNCDSFALEHFATVENSCWKASCNFNLKGYGDIAVPALLDILNAGVDNQPHELNTQTFMVDRANVAEHYTAK